MLRTRLFSFRSNSRYRTLADRCSDRQQISILTVCMSGVVQRNRRLELRQASQYQSAEASTSRIRQAEGMSRHRKVRQSHASHVHFLMQSRWFFFSERQRKFWWGHPILQRYKGGIAGLQSEVRWLQANLRGKEICYQATFVPLAHIPSLSFASDRDAAPESSGETVAKL